MKIFYSWQGDLPNKTNRGFIHQALENAAKAIREDESIEVDPSIDRDTAGVPGAPDITATIFKKIDDADLFVADVSIIESARKRPIPNPNVLIELGYALKALGTERIILVINEAFGLVEELPFDLRQKRIIKYQMLVEDSERAPERSKLTGFLVKAIIDVINHTPAKAAPQPAAPVTPHPAEELDRLMEFKAQWGRFHHTEIGNKCARQEFISLYDELEQKAKDFNERSTQIELNWSLENDKRHCSLHYGSLNLVAHMSQPQFLNILEGTVLYCGLQESGNVFKAPEEIRGYRYLPELDKTRGVGWVEDNPGKTFLSTSDMANLWFERFIKELTNRI